MKTGIYGGTFSPVHNGHVRAAELFLEKLSLDRLIIMPAGIPPHKEVTQKVDGAIRYEMCLAAFLPLSDKVEVSDFEIKKDGKSYTIDTARHFEGDELWILCGEDMLLSLDTWYRADELMRRCSFAALSRTLGENEKMRLHAEKLRDEYGAVIEIIDAEPFEVSSTEIREKVKSGEDISSLVPGGVLEIINDRNLYR